MSKDEIEMEISIHQYRTIFPSKCNEEKWFAQNDRGNNFHASCTVRFVKPQHIKMWNKILKHNVMCISNRREEK